MRTPFFHGVGGVLSADIAVPEHERELGFYSQILTTGETPFWRDDLTNNRGTPIIGLGARSPEYDSLPLQWMPHIQVSDVATSAALALKLGGTELLHAKGDDGQSQWAVMEDQGGAAFGLIPVVEELNAEAEADRSGHIAWLSLAAPEVEATRDFYRQVVGWSAEASTIVEHDDLPRVWLLSLPVGDLDESLRRVRTLGGEVLGERSRPGRVVIRDPIGVCLALQPADDSQRPG